MPGFNAFAAHRESAVAIGCDRRGGGEEKSSYPSRVVASGTTHAAILFQSSKRFSIEEVFQVISEVVVDAVKHDFVGIYGRLDQKYTLSKKYQRIYSITID